MAQSPDTGDASNSTSYALRVALFFPNILADLSCMVGLGVPHEAVVTPDAPLWSRETSVLDDR